jgi:hypothetical protein
VPGAVKHTSDFLQPRTSTTGFVVIDLSANNWAMRESEIKQHYPDPADPSPPAGDLHLPRPPATTSGDVLIW